MERHASVAGDSPTPIWISRRTRNVLVALGLGVLLLLVSLAPTILVLTLGGAALALVLSFPVRALSRFMPRSLAIALSLLATTGLVVLLVAFVIPILVEQLGALVNAVPGIAQNLGKRLPSVLRWLGERGLLPASREEFLDELQQQVLGGIQGFASRLLSGLGRFLTGALGVAVNLFGIVFLAIYLVADSRRLEALAIRTTPHRYRRDVRDLWTAFSHTLSRYIGGLGLSLLIQGGLSAIALYFLGVPYAILLGVWVSITALVPYLGAWIGAVPAVLLALSISPLTAVLTAALFLLIQQLEGNVLTPRIQGEAVRVHPILIFLAVIAGGELFGIFGVVFAVPAVAVLRVLFDFFRARLHVKRNAPPVVV
ncbi:MAG TPA: AI-2E family transporter [Gemmatimonadaceae bacterium]|nr:AI-2E family transporter [Gemmatimonadaceae bacterium]